MLVEKQEDGTYWVKMTLGSHNNWFWLVTHKTTHASAILEALCFLAEERVKLNLNVRSII